MFYLVIGVLALLAGQPVHSETVDTNMLKSLANAGYTDIEMESDCDTLTVGYWPLGFRDDYQAYRELYRTLRNKSDGSFDTFELHHGVWGFQLIGSTGNIDTVPDDIQYDFGVQEDIQLPSPRVMLLFDIPFDASFGNYFDSLVYKTGITPDMRIQVLPGVVMYGQLDLYVHNEYDPDMWYKPGDIGVSIIRALNEKTVTVANIGVFRDNVYGMDCFFKTHIREDSIAFSIHGGLFGNAIFEDNTFYYGSMKHNYLVAEAEVPVPEYDCYVTLSYGKYLYGDDGLGVGVSRIFKDINIGFQGVVSDGDLIGFIDVSIPLYPPQRKSVSYYGVGMVRNFDFTYRYDSDGMPDRPKNPKAFVPHTGITYDKIIGNARPQHFKYMLENYNDWD